MESELLMPVSVDSLTFANARQTLQTGLDAIRAGQHTFDLANVAHADSSSIAVMLAWQRAAKTAFREIRFLNTPENILSLAALYGVTDLLELEPRANTPTE